MKTTNKNKTLENKIKNSPEIIRKYFNYIIVIKNRSYKTLRTYLYSIYDFLKFEIEHKKENTFEGLSQQQQFELLNRMITKDFLSSIDESDILSYLFSLQQNNNNATTRNNRLSAIKSLYRYLEQKENIPNNAMKIDSAKIDKKLPIYMTLEECKEVLSAVKENGNERDFCIFVLLMNCGMRVSELVSIDIKDISETTIKIMGKGAKERTIYLNNACINAIEEYKKKRLECSVPILDKQALFISETTGKRITSRRVEQIVAKVMKECGLSDKGYSPHKLRHTAATLMYQNGTDVRVLKDILGHESLSTTQIYTHINNQQLQEAVNNNPLADYK